MNLGKKYLTSDEIRPLAKRSDLWGYLLIVHCWGIIFLALAAFSFWPTILSASVAVMLIGSRQLGLAILMHEAAHNAMFRSKNINDYVGEWICGNAIFADIKTYRTYHLKHHRHTQTENDPDLRLSRPFPTTRASMIRKLTRDITGQTGLKQRAQQFMLALKLGGDMDHIPTPQEMAQAFSGGSIQSALLANSIIFAFMWAFGAWWWW